MRHTLLSRSALFLASLVVPAVACDGSCSIGPVTCDRDALNAPLGTTDETTFLSACVFWQDVDWHDAEGNIVRSWKKGERILDQCARIADTSACAAQAHIWEAMLGAVDANVSLVVPDYEVVLDDEGVGGGGGCRYYKTCDPSQYPYPGQVPEEATGYWGHCMNDLSEPQLFPGNGAPPGTIQYRYWALGNPIDGFMHFSDACGYDVYFDTTSGVSEDEQCKMLCQDMLFSILGDEFESNCETVGKSDLCEAEPGGPDGFVWETAGAAPNHAPLACDGGQCCSAFGPAACKNLKQSTVGVSVAQHIAPLDLMATLELDGQTIRAPMRGSLAYSASSCTAANGTCPLYVEALSFGTTAPVSATVPGPTGSATTIRLKSLALNLLTPVLGGYRPSSGQIQIAPDVLMMSASGILNRGNGPKQTALVATNPARVDGTVATNGKVTLSGHFEVAPGVRLSVTTR